MAPNPIDQGDAAPPTAMGPPPFDGTGASQNTKPGFGAAPLGQANPLQLVPPGSVSGMQAHASSSNMNQCRSCRTFTTVSPQQAEVVICSRRIL